MRCYCANMKKKVTALEADAIFTGKIRWVHGVIAYITFKVGKQYHNSIHGNSRNYFQLFLITIVRE